MAVLPLDRLTSNTLRRAATLSDWVFDRPLRMSANKLAEKLDVPAHFVQQLLAIEDKRFLYHIGVDPIAVIRALVFNIGTTSSYLHGASTVPQQLYSNRLRRSGFYQRTISFKVAQSAWSIGQTLLRSKSSVLTAYLDSIYFGRSYYGIKSAAMGYCRRSKADLTIADGFFLAERIARPNVVLPGRVAMLIARRPIAALFRANRSAAGELAELYDRHFGCGRKITICLERSLKKPVAHTSTYLGDVLSEQ